MANVSYVGDGKVYLIAGGGKCYSSIAAKFCRSEKSAAEIIGSEESLSILKSIVESGHQAALEFDEFIFGIEGYARVTEVQLVRKRHASYNIKSGRVDKHGNRSFDMVIPKDIDSHSAMVALDPGKLSLVIDDDYLDPMGVISGNEIIKRLNIPDDTGSVKFLYDFYTRDILDIIETWYNTGVDKGMKEEELRYIKPQATEFKACIKMNLSGLLDWFKIRMCNRAQTEIRDLATKIYKICVAEFPTVFENAGPNCKCLGYCPEKEQCAQLKGKIPTKEEALAILRANYNK